jgi:hypothetical protein
MMIIMFRLVEVESAVKKVSMKLNTLDGSIQNKVCTYFGYFNNSL